MKARMIRQIVLMSALSLGMAATLQAAPQNLDSHTINRLAVNQSVALGLSETRQALRDQRQDWLQASLNEGAGQQLAQQEGWLPVPGEGLRITENPVAALVDSSEPMAARLPGGLVIYIGNR